MPLSHVLHRLLLGCRILCKGVCGGGQSIADCPRDLRSWVHDGCAGTWLGARFVDFAAILGGVTHERQWLRPALDLGGNGAHPLGGRCTDAAAIVPSRAIIWRPCLSAVLRRGGKLCIVVNLPFEQGLLATQQCAVRLQGEDS